MAGLDKDTPIPTGVVLHQKSRVIELQYGSDSYRVPFELLRVYSPSAEVQGHGPGQEILQTGKREVMVADISAVGHYAIQLTFSDGHDTGIYSWDYLYRLAHEQDTMWREYLDRLQAAGLDRDAPMKASGGHGVHGHACGHH